MEPSRNARGEVRFDPVEARHESPVARNFQIFSRSRATVAKQFLRRARGKNGRFFIFHSFYMYNALLYAVNFRCTRNAFKK